MGKIRSQEGADKIAAKLNKDNEFSNLNRQKEMFKKSLEKDENPEMVEIFDKWSTLFQRLWGGGDGDYHRTGRTFCPHCDYYGKIKTGLGDLPSKIPFMLPPFLHQVIVNNEIGRIDSCIVISSCPKCGEYSWEHIDLDDLKTYVLQGAKIDLKKVRELRSKEE